MTNSYASPEIAIVIPLFKHSVLVADALESAIGQKTRYSYIVIVVNDGCPFKESDLQVKSAAAAYPDKIRYVVQQNRGLSAARNTGIDFALKHFPSVQAVYLMDADNSILPGSIDAAYSKLIEDPAVSWVYPNIDMFGIRRNFDYSGPYSVLRHTQYNVCEAGSMVHRRVFDAGIRFDETMKLGYEDWDFWLTAATRGFRGAHLPHFGFRYRNRGESMLSEAHRIDGELQAFLARKHRELLGKRNLIRLESEEAPRYAIIFTDTNQVLLTSGSTETSNAISSAEFDEMFWRNIIMPTRQHVPPFFVVMARSTFEALSRVGLILWVLHDCEITLKEMNFSCLVIEPRPDHAFEVLPSGRPGDCDVLALNRDLALAIIRSVDTSWVERVVAPSDEMNISTKTLRVPRRPGFALTEKGSAALNFLLRVRSWRASPFRTAAERAWIWRELSVPARHNLYFNIRAAFDGHVVYPRPLSGERNIGFVLPIASFGGVERVAYNLGQQFAAAGWQVHFYVIGQTRIEIPPEFAHSKASINFLTDPAFDGWDQNAQYQGTALPAARNSPQATERMVAAMAWLDAVVNCHSGEFNAAASDLRKLGVKTATHVHLLDLSPVGRSVGHPMIALAYEHAYDLVLCTSRQLVAWMHGAGCPSEKLLHVPNAPGHPVDADRRLKVLASRSGSHKTRLNVVYLGRLDRQKGIDRLAEVVKQSRELDLKVNWRIVGSGIANDSPVPTILRDMIEPPQFDSHRLTSIFAWADVMVLLSDYEGVPLAILEAQRLGVVVIATSVGAVSEVVSNGHTGFLVDCENAVENTIGLLRLLAEVPALRSRIAANASKVIEWPEAASELVQQISRLTAEQSAQVGPHA
jgi:glycosyltransferase involved in cell wall biosynthesis